MESNKKEGKAKQELTRQLCLSQEIAFYRLVLSQVLVLVL